MSPDSERSSSDAWARPVERLSGAINVAGKRPTSPIQGFGRMWQKTYRVRLEGSATTPRELIAAWKEHFGTFWPKKARFVAPLSGIAPGEVAALKLSMPGGLRLSTGVLVMYADDESFTLMTPQGHMFAGWITFSAATEPDGVTCAQAQVLMRASDPLYEIGLTMGGAGEEDRHWEHTLRELARHFGVEGEVTRESVCVDKRRQWSNVANVWQNAGVRSGLHATTAPIRRLRRPFRRHAS
ncbi:MAG: hypothetical protein ABI317_06870 [Gaiellales bacterium]